MIKFVVAIACIAIGFALMLAGGLAFIAGQWIIIFGAATAGQIKMGAAWLVAALLGGSFLQYSGVRLLASEPRFGWPWIAFAFVPAIMVAAHYGAGLAGVLIAVFMVPVVSRQVKNLRAKRLAINGGGQADRGDVRA